ncbi:hypothetical protein CEXT_287421 [Caerostris extrusa]|uniref:Uncharacterized protein n=1 Tax=Caerostris extrusa TaxID=172846 RepID=A0AAV4PX02_CAEEX|nr:hypothetical protein CEXT_287421 [Caerostris extrusa]
MFHSWWDTCQGVGEEDAPKFIPNPRLLKRGKEIIAEVLRNTSHRNHQSMEDLRRLGGILHAPLSARRILGARHSSLGICQTDYAGICSTGRKGKLLLKKKKKVLRARLIS